MTIPEKTLKEKVQLARKAVGRVYFRIAAIEIDEALTALEERVAELEKKQATHEISAVYVPSKQELELTWRDLQTGKAVGLTTVVSTAKGEVIAELVPPCVYWPATTKEIATDGK